ncbi:MAG: DNA repair protein RecO C-terminal domain-containing protein, partial [Alphaproteobacteria bacterium]|nr:DNA repair protein RecO C-terminal domain-containing protein [Alphaproteobacteria bacterium]
LCDAALPEREGPPGLFHGLTALFEALESEYWGAVYVMWEIALLRELGFALVLDRCAAGGDPATLAYVSPKTGRAVSEAAGVIYKDRLLALPAFLKPVFSPPVSACAGDVPPASGGGRGGAEDVLKGLKLTGYFLEHWVFVQASNGVPAARRQFQERFEKSLF